LDPLGLPSDMQKAHWDPQGLPLDRQKVHWDPQEWPLDKQELVHKLVVKLEGMAELEDNMEQPLEDTLFVQDTGDL